LGRSGSAQSLLASRGAHPPPLGVGRARPPHPPSRGWRDWTLVAVLVPLPALEAALRPDLGWRLLSVVVLVALVPTMLWRRTRPLLMLAVAFGVTGLASALTGGAALHGFTAAYLLVLPYALFHCGSGREVVIRVSGHPGQAVGLWPGNQRRSGGRVHRRVLDDGAGRGAAGRGPRLLAQGRQPHPARPGRPRRRGRRRAHPPSVRRRRPLWHRFIGHGAVTDPWCRRHQATGRSPAPGLDDAGFAIGLGAGTQVVTTIPWALLVGQPAGLARALLMAAG
jgi:hypothetical protein